MENNGKFRRKVTNFTQVSNFALLDEALSLTAKGLLSIITYYITIPDFTLYRSFLQKKSGLTEYKFRMVWKELQDQGYIKEYKIRDANGKFAYEYELLDNPKKMDSTRCRNSTCGESTRGDSTCGESTHINKTGRKNNESNNIKQNNSSSMMILLPGMNEKDIRKIVEMFKGLPEEFLLEAIKRTYHNKPNNPIAYIKTILNDWKEFDYTVSDLAFQNSRDRIDELVTVFNENCPSFDNDNRQTLEYLANLFSYDEIVNALRETTICEPDAPNMFERFLKRL